jgi:two-component system cell cycle sensor histidine kinase/response regulator CckA
MAENPTKRLSDLFHEAGLIDRLGEIIPGLVYVYDLIQQRNVFANRPMADLLGYSPEQVRALGEQLLTSIIHPEDLPRVVRHHRSMATMADEQVVEIEYRVRTAAGDWLWLHSWESVFTRDESGRTCQFLGIAHDVTARVRAEDELRDSQRRLAESEQRWRSIAENPFDFVVVIDRDYKYTFVNFLAPGLDREALIGKATPFDFVAPEDHAVMQAAFDVAFNEGRAASYDVYIPTLDKWYSSLVGPIREGDQVTHASILTRDITAEKRMQQQARQAEEQVRAMELKLAQSAKLEAVGQLAGGIAHDFNNLLTGIAGIGDLLSSRLDPTDTNLADLADLRQAVARGAGLTRQLLAFSRQQTLETTILDLGALLDETARMLRRLIREDVELEFNKTGDDLFARGDRTQLEQVLVNLALNARDAMPRGGRLRFTLASIDMDVAACQAVPEARPGPYVRLRVADTGDGMDAATVARMFEPFFTTKPIGEGTGLGLALVHGIVRQNGGFILVQSQPGQGTAIEVHLPRCGPGAAAPTKPPGARPGGTETILMVEDDAMTLRLTQQVLAALGYRVETETRGDRALKRIESGLAFDLLLTDVLLPGIDGHQLYQRARALRPGVAAVFMSGYTADVFAKESVAGGAFVFLQKPFSHDDLAEKVRAALDARANAAP